ncbi:MAG TPA: NUDIX hydrolase [Candidatus Acidoferrales bacterium]|nr:NUDIX hydrolase [Candidatus Acidoferrales bacterium]
MPDTTILSKETVFTSKYFKIVRLELERNGKQYSKEVIERNPVVIIIPYTFENEIYIESQYRVALNRTVQELVAGNIEDDDNPLEAAKRELREETGLTAGSWKKLYEWDLSGNLHSKIHLFAATNLEEGEQQLDPDEEITVMKIPFEDVFKKIENGEMTNAPHIAALLLFDRLRKEGKV